MTAENVINSISVELSEVRSALLKWSNEDITLLKYKPKNGGWSSLGILEHITLTSHYLLKIIDKASVKAIQQASSNDVSIDWNTYDLLPKRLEEVGDHKSFFWNRPEHMEPSYSASLSDIMSKMTEQLDQFVLPDVYIIARLDGRGFTRLTKELLSLERPFDETFRDAMIATVSHLMNCGFNVTYGYCQSDEISILFDKNENGFARKTRKLLSVLSGEASAKFTSHMGVMGVFDCRIIPLPLEELVVDYFRWRSEDANRNALNAWCYWTLRNAGTSVEDATKQFEGKSIAYKNQFLFENGINYNDLPAWQKRGVGFYCETVETSAVNPKTKSVVAASRRRLDVQMNLPLNLEYESLIKKIISNSSND